MSYDAGGPSSADKINVDKVGMFIIVGKKGLAGGSSDKSMSGEQSKTTISDQRKGVINIYNKDNKETPVQSISQDDAKTILSDYNVNRTP